MYTNGSSASRRRFLAGAVAGTAVLANSLRAKERIPVALQLYSIREECKRDLPSTLAAVAKMGYDGVEFAGYYDRDAKQLRKLLDDLNLKAFSTHIAIKTLVGDELEKTVEFNQILGNSRLTVAWLPASKTIQPWFDVAAQFNAVAEKLKERHMRVGFHNHVHELDLVEGKRPWDVFCDNTNKDVTLQMDLTHFPARGLDPVDYMKRYAGRVRMLHCKDHPPEGRDVLLGDGTIDWKKIFAASESVAGVECYIVEQERYPAPLTPMECVAKCLQNFRRLHG
jgi:sugar phosphate isomerase/epimerase